MEFITYIKEKFYLKNLFILNILSYVAILAVLASTINGIYFYNKLANLVGIFFILFCAYALSSNRSAINTKLVRVALLLHYVLAFFMLRTHIGTEIAGVLANGINKIYVAANAGLIFLFGNLSSSSGPWSFIFALQVLPVIIFFGAFMSILFYMQIIQKIVNFIAKLIQPILGTSGAETLCAVANSFLGQTEAPLLIKNYLGSMTKSEFLVVMLSGMGTISGAILVVFANMGVPIKHLLASTIMAIPATILIAKIIYPETENTSTNNVAAEFKSPAKNILDAISIGTQDGLALALNVGAMLMAFISLIALTNMILFYSYALIYKGLIMAGFSFPFNPLTLENIFGVLFLPFSWLLGLSGTEANNAAQLLGIKLTVNEMVAYSSMVKTQLSERTISLLTYALCGFANFSCIGIQIGGIGALVPEKKAWLSELGIRSLIGATLANLLSAFVAGLLI